MKHLSLWVVPVAALLAAPSLSHAQRGGGGEYNAGHFLRDLGNALQQSQMQQQQQGGHNHNWGGSSPGFQNTQSGIQRAPYMPSSPGVQNTMNNPWNNGFHDHYEPQYQRPHYHQPYYQQPNYNYQSQYAYDSYSRPEPEPTYSNQPITIAMPGEEAGLCSYSLICTDDSYNYSISPGGIQTFTEDRNWQVRFDRGNGNGSVTYNLRPGVYRFRQSSNGWELYRGR